jgi:hypothetical protein
MGTSTKKIAGARRLLAGAAIAAAIAGAGIAASGTASAFPGGMGICPGGGGGYGAFGYCDGDTYPDGSYDHTVMIFGGWQASILTVMRRREISVNGRASAAIAALPACAALAIGGVLFGCGSANADTYYANCAAAWADHAAPLHQG